MMHLKQDDDIRQMMINHCMCRQDDNHNNVEQINMNEVWNLNQSTLMMVIYLED